MKTLSEITELRKCLREMISKSTFTQIRLSDVTGIPQPVLSHFISGKRGLGGEYALRLARFLNATLAGIAQVQATPPPPEVSHNTNS